MADQPLIDDAQLQNLLSALGKLGSHTSHWDYTTAIPTFLGALLGFGAAMLADWLKTRRERKTRIRERREKELAQLSGTNTMLAFNVETLVHTAMQQIIPHFEASHTAVKELHAGRKPPGDYTGHMITRCMQEAMKRCPEPNLTQADLFVDLSFLLGKDPELLKQTGWVTTYVRDLKFILRERNKLIDLATTGGEQEEITRLAFERQIEHQANVSIPEVVNCYQLFKAIERTMDGISRIISDLYKDVEGPKLKMAKPAIYDQVILKLENIVKKVVPDLPPEEPT